MIFSELAVILILFYFFNIVKKNTLQKFGTHVKKKKNMVVDTMTRTISEDVA